MDKRRSTIAPKSPAKIETRSGDEDGEPPIEDVGGSNSIGSVDSEASYTSLTDYRNRQKMMAGAASNHSSSATKNPLVGSSATLVLCAKTQF